MSSRTRGTGAKQIEDLIEATNILIAQSNLLLNQISGILNPVDVSDRAARLLGIVYGNLAQLRQRPVSFDLFAALRYLGVEIDPRDVSDRWARLLGQVDLARVLGAALTAANPVIVGLYDAAGNRMPSMDVAARPGYVDAIVVKATTIMHNAVALTVDDTDTDSAELDCAAYRKFLIGYDITETGTLVDGDRVLIRVQFREAGGTWRYYENGPFGGLTEEESTTPCNLCVSGECVGENIRVVLRTDYTNANPLANYFTVTAKLTLMR